MWLALALVVALVATQVRNLLDRRSRPCLLDLAWVCTRRRPHPLLCAPELGRLSQSSYDSLKHLQYLAIRGIPAREAPHSQLTSNSPDASLLNPGPQIVEGASGKEILHLWPGSILIAAVMLLTRCMNATQARESMDWEVRRHTTSRPTCRTRLKALHRRQSWMMCRIGGRQVCRIRPGLERSLTKHPG
jgi:hypothetical protein